MRKPTPENSLQARYPQLALDWSKNNVLKPDEVYPNSVTVFSWQCHTCSYEWEAKPNYRVMHPNCPACLGLAVIPGVTTLGEEYQQWSKENLKLVHQGSKQVVEWECPTCSYVWKQKVNVFVKNFCCPQCVKKDKLLNSTHPAYELLSKEWASINTKFLEQCSYGSGYKASWVCSTCSHEWVAAVFSRVKGSGCPKCASNSRTRVIKKSFADVASDVLKNEWSSNNIGSPEDYSYDSGYKASWVCSKCSHQWKATIVDSATCDRNCPKCVNKVSKAEDAIYSFLQKHGLDVIRSSRDIISPMEIDMYIPSLKIGIEFNGIYWHSDKFKTDHLYHQRKWEAAKNAGIQLIQIWEDDWVHKQSIVLNMLENKLRLTQQRKVFARKTKIVHVSKIDAENFLNGNHIQGFKSGSSYIGLEDEENVLVALMVLVKEPGGMNRLNIVRYATSVHVIGGFTKILSYVEKILKPDSFVTFSDNMISDGGLYENNGFIVDKLLSPDYMYVVKNVRVHKFGYRIKRFRNDPDLQWMEGLTERELAVLNNIPRVWDAGKVRWVKYCVND